jgi:prolipoprotein diacylglyceryltransferase
MHDYFSVAMLFIASYLLYFPLTTIRKLFIARMISFIIWNGSPIVFSVGPVVLRWYGVLFVLGFIIARIGLTYLYKKENKSTHSIEVLTRYVLIATAIGARLGYVIFYEPELIWKRPLEIFLPVAFQPSFHFTGLENLSGPGAILGILVAIWIYSKKNRPNDGFLEVLDRISLVTALCGVFLCSGSFLNSEVSGIPTSSNAGFVQSRPVADGLLKIPCCIMRTPGGENPVNDILVKKDTARETSGVGHSPLLLYLFFKPGATEERVKEFLIGDVKTFLFDHAKTIYEPGTEPLHYTIFQEDTELYTARVRTIGIARHPTLLYETVAFLSLFLLLCWVWRGQRHDNMVGRISGVFLVSLSILFFVVGFFKEEQMAFNGTLPLTISQLVSINFIVAGVIILVRIRASQSTT